MKNTSTTLELPEGSKATIQGKVINGKNYLVVEVEQEPEKSDVPEWKNFKRGDVLKFAHLSHPVIYVIFDEYKDGSNNTYFKCLFNSIHAGNSMWFSEQFRKATDKEKAKFFKWLRDEEGLEWDGEKLVEIPKPGDWVIVWDEFPDEAKVGLLERFREYCSLPYQVAGGLYIHAIKWDGTKEQYEKVLRGKI